MQDEHGEEGVAPFSVVKSEVVSFFVIKWPPNLMSIVMLQRNSWPPI